MGKEILINIDAYEKRVAILKDKALEEYYIERGAEQTIVGNIYKGRVETIVPGMEAAFVDIGLEKNGFLYVSDIVGQNIEPEQLWVADDVVADDTFVRVNRNIKDLLKEGQEVYVQVVKEPFGTKGPRLTSQITLPGRLLVYTPFEEHRGISKRIEASVERQKLREILNELPLPKGSGVIVRTLSSGATKADFIRELKFLDSQWQKIRFKMMRVRAPSLIHVEHDLVMRIVRDSLSPDTERLTVDSRDEFQKILRLVGAFLPQLRAKIHLYREPAGLFQKYNIEPQIEKIYDRRVDLKKGGYIVIEKTEGLVAIDVNSGKFTKSRHLEETAYLVNLEAAREIARQLRLRDIGGIIVIDFIDMEKSEHRKKVMAVLEKELENDKAKNNVLSLSGLGLVEMSRQRVRRGLESLSHQVCPYCAGRGTVKSELTMVIEIMRKIQKLALHHGKRSISVCVNPAVSLRLLNEHKPELSRLERQLRVRINVTSNPAQHIEDAKIKVE